MKILQRVVSGAVLLSFVCTQAGAATLQRLPTQYASSDALGSITLVTQDDATVVEKRTYDAFGKRRNPSWSAVDVYGQIAGAQLDQGYTSHVEDFESDTVHMRGRTYDPKLARFTSADPVIDGVNATQRWNRYAYVSNNPLKYTDPSGFDYDIDSTTRPDDQGGVGSPLPSDPPQMPASQGAPGSHGSPPPPPTPAPGPTQDKPKGISTSPPGQIGGSAGAGGACAGCRGNGVADSEYGGGGSYGNHNQSARAERERNAREAQQLQKNMKSDAARQRRAKEQLDGRGGSSANGNSFGMAAAPPLEGALAGGATTGMTVGGNLVLAAGGLAVAATAIVGIAAAGLIYMSANDNDNDKKDDKKEPTSEELSKEIGRLIDELGKVQEEGGKHADRIAEWYVQTIDKLLVELINRPKEIDLGPKGGGGAPNDNGSGSE